jgi:hypothetical protein
MYTKQLQMVKSLHRWHIHRGLASNRILASPQARGRLEKGIKIIWHSSSDILTLY